MLTTLLEKADLKSLYSPPVKIPVLVEVPELAFLMVDGEGDPNLAPSYREALEALFAASYTLKFAVKKARGLDYHVAPLESLWWGKQPYFLGAPKSEWHWTAMIRQPDEVTGDEVADAIAAAGDRRPLPGLARLRFERFAEGRCAQVMHLGPYSAEGPTIESLHDFIEAEGYQPRGKHHEIYMGDPRRSAPEKLRTIVRQPISRT